MTVIDYDPSLDNLKATIHDLWAADSALSTLHPAERLFTGRIPSSIQGGGTDSGPPEMPYTRLELPCARKGTRTTDTEYPIQDVKFHVWTDTSNEADPISEAILHCYRDQAFYYTVGTTTYKVIDTRDGGTTQREITMPNYTAWETIVSLTMRIMKNR